MDRDFVAGEVVIDEEAEALVDGKFFHQRGAGAHRHRADDLAARRFGVEYAAGGAHCEHAANADFPGIAVHRDFDEMAAESRLLILLVEVAVFDVVFGRQQAVLCRVR